NISSSKTIPSPLAIISLNWSVEIFAESIYTSHAESIYVEIDSANISTDQFKEIIASGEGIVLEDDPNTQTYPTPLNSANKKEVFVGRIRKDLDNDKGFHLWVVSDNLIKGAAWNTVQIAKSLVEQNLIK